MRKIQKHHFEPVSLLTVENGILEAAIIPAQNQPNWLVPKALILSIDDFYERIWTYLWGGQEVAVYHLVPKDVPIDKLVVLEGSTDVHRLALQTTGDIRYTNLKISDVKDMEMSDDIKETINQHVPKLVESADTLDYLYQLVSIKGVPYIVPELDLITHRLVDLDS